jgi:hypothetical protein
MQLAKLRPVVRGSLVVFIAGLVLFTTCSSGALLAQTFSPYSDFEAMTPSELATLQVKLTYVGMQRVARRSIVFTAAGNQPNIALFEPFERVGVEYNSDAFSPLSFAATVQELDALVDGVGLLPAITDGESVRSRS